MKLGEKLNLKRIEFRTSILQQEKKLVPAKAKILVYNFNKRVLRADNNGSSI